MAGKEDWNFGPLWGINNPLALETKNIFGFDRCNAMVGGMQELSYYIDQLFDSWQGKLMLSTILTALSQLVEQFGATFGADTFLVLLLFVLVWMALGLGILVAVKKRRFDYSTVGQGILKLPLYCLYLFLIGSIGVSIEHSISIALPLLNLFIAYLTASEVFIIVRQLQTLGVKVPPLLLFVVRGARLRFESVMRKGLATKESDNNQEDGRNE